VYRVACAGPAVTVCLITLAFWDVLAFWVLCICVMPCADHNAPHLQTSSTCAVMCTPYCTLARAMEPLESVCRSTDRLKDRLIQSTAARRIWTVIIRLSAKITSGADSYKRDAIGMGTCKRPNRQGC
jgi:hypothetical protein